MIGSDDRNVVPALERFGAAMIEEGTLATFKIRRGRVTASFPNGATEGPMTPAMAAQWADCLADDVWRRVSLSSGPVMAAVEEWAGKLEYQPKADYALEVARCALEGGTVAREWLEIDRPWQWKVRERLAKLGVPRPEIERACCAGALVSA